MRDTVAERLWNIPDQSIYLQNRRVKFQYG